MLLYKLLLVNVMGPNYTVVPANFPTVYTFLLVFVVVARVVKLPLDEVFTACQAGDLGPRRRLRQQQ